MKNQLNWKLKTGKFLFKKRTFTPIPIILIVFIFFKPMNLEKGNIPVTLAGIFLSIIGEIIRIFAVGYSFYGTSGRESYLRADNLNVKGIYSIVRNPLYIGNFFIFSGVLIVYSNLIALLLFDFFLIIQYYFIILSEENFLLNKYRKIYEHYCMKVSKIFPNFKNYQKPDHKFNFKKALFKEKSSILNLLIMFIIVFAFKERILLGRIDNPFIYIVPACIFILAYIIIKLQKKRWEKSTDD